MAMQQQKTALSPTEQLMVQSLERKLGNAPFAGILSDMSVATPTGAMPSAAPEAAPAPKSNGSSATGDLSEARSIIMQNLMELKQNPIKVPKPNALTMALNPRAVSEWVQTQQEVNGGMLLKYAEALYRINEEERLSAQPSAYQETLDKGAAGLVVEDMEMAQRMERAQSAIAMLPDELRAELGPRITTYAILGKDLMANVANETPEQRFKRVADIGEKISPEQAEAMAGSTYANDPTAASLLRDVAGLAAKDRTRKASEKGEETKYAGFKTLGELYTKVGERASKIQADAGTTDEHEPVDTGRTDRYGEPKVIDRFKSKPNMSYDDAYRQAIKDLGAEEFFPNLAKPVVEEQKGLDIESQRKKALEKLNGRKPAK